MFVPVAEYMPDQPDLQNPGSGYVRNCLPRTAQSYGPMPSLAAYSNALTARCQGAFACQDGAGNVNAFAGHGGRIGAGNLAPLLAVPMDYVRKPGLVFPEARITSHRPHIV